MSQYRILGVLADGGMGRIYLARHLELEVDRIIKTLRPDHEKSTLLRDQFVSEARRSARLAHPNLATVHDYAIGPSGRGYLVMEYVDGLTLHQARRKKGCLAPGLILEVGIQTLRALECLHRAGLVHRDVSPDNILLTTREGLPRVVLIDLGISKDLGAAPGVQSTLPGTFKGKPAYASPEQFASALGVGAIDTRSDLYSLGVVLYQLAAGELPPDGLEIDPTVGLGEVPPDGGTAAPGTVPSQLWPVLEKALATDPEDRFQEAGDFRQALEDLEVLWHTGPAEIAAEAKWIGLGWEKATDEKGSAAVQADLDAAFTTRSSGRSRKQLTLGTVTHWARDNPRRSLAAGLLLLLLPFGLKALVAPGADALPSPAAEQREISAPATTPPELPAERQAADSQPIRQLPPTNLPALALVCNDPHFSLLVEELYRGAGRAISVLGSREEARRLAETTGMPRHLIEIELTQTRSTVQIRNRSLPACEIMTSARLLEMPSARQLAAKSLNDKRGDCPTALAATSRALVEKLRPSLPQG